MRKACKTATFCSAALLFALSAHGQDSPPSLGDAARQARQQKQAKTAQPSGKNAPSVKPVKVITNDEIPAHFKPPVKTAASDQDQNENTPEPTPADDKAPAELWKSQISAQKSQVSALQSQIDQLSESIHFAPGNCAANCAQWNERQKEKQQQVERLKSQLEDQQKRLEDMQEQARKQGYGSSVYDP
jgi:predicted RNase H-like nuclease (RuvC/YqgF family)